MFRSLLIIAILLMPGMVSAASISPSLIESSIGRGGQAEETITIINTSSTEQTYYLDVIEFSATDTGGEPQFISTQDIEPEHLRWIVFPSDVITVPAASQGEIPLKISIPSSVGSGGYYAALTISPTPEELIASNGAVVEAKIAVLLLITVEGETTERAELLDFSSDNSDRWLSSLNLGMSYRIQNQGNVHVLPKGTVKVIDIFGRTILVQDANVTLGRVLPASTRTYKVGVSDGDSEGWYELINAQAKLGTMGPVTVRLDLTYGLDDEVLSSSVRFWVVPWQLMVSITLLASAILGLYRLGGSRAKKQMRALSKK